MHRSPRTLTVVLIAASALALTTAAGRIVAVPTLFLAYAACAVVVWFAGARAIALCLVSRAAARRARHAAASSPAALRVALLYCTADDLDAEALTTSMRQTAHAHTVILDDSRSAAGRRRVDAFAAAHGATIVRRADRTGFKAGNLNNALRELHGRFDAYVLLDSDTRLPRDFVALASSALAADPSLACVQGVPSAGGRSVFARLYGPLVHAHATANHVPRAQIGLPLFVGRGAMISARALDEVGGFPEAVAEDLALSVRLRAHGWRIAQRPDLVFAEAYPIDYAAFRTQAAKTAEGAAEFLRRRPEHGTAQALLHRERLDAVVETALLPIGAAAGLALIVIASLLHALGWAVPVEATVLTAVLAFAPLLPATLPVLRLHGPVAAAGFAFAASALYASIAILTVRHAGAVLRGRRAVFTVTPKSGRRTGFANALDALRIECICALGAGGAAAALSAPALAIAFALPAATGLALLLLGPAEARPVGASRRSATPGRGIRFTRTTARRSVLVREI